MSSNPSKLTSSRILSLSTFAWSALAALTIGCGSPGAASPTSAATDPATQAALELPASPGSGAQTLGQLGFTRAELAQNGTPLFLDGRVAADIRDGDSAAKTVLQSLAPAYRLAATDSLRPLSISRDKGGRLYAKLQQVHGGVPVLHRELVVQAESDGALSTVLGELVPDLVVDVSASRLSGDEALSRAFAKLALSGSTKVHEAPALVVFAPLPGEEGETALAYRALVEYTSKEGLQLEELVVRASDGAVLGRYSQMHEAVNRKVYDLGGKCIGLTGTLPGTLKRSEGGAKDMDDAVNRIYDGVGATYFYYKLYHGRDSYDGAGAALNSTAHVTFPGGASCSGANAAWLGPPYSQMVYGDGDGMVLLDLTLGLDVSAHELTHAVTSVTSKLVYRNESGALNEAMSDIFGASAEAWSDSGGTDTTNPMTVTPSMNTWLIGEKVAGPSLMGGALRFMSDPTKDKQSKDYYPERYTGTDDNGGVHLNSGIANLAFYLVSEGGTHPRSKTQTVVPGIGLEKAQRIFYLANTSLMTSTTNFQAARVATAKAAENLYGRCSKEWQNIHMAWDAVGVAGGWIPCVTPPSGF